MSKVKTIRLTKAMAKRGVFMGHGWVSNGAILYPQDMGDDKVASPEAATEYYGAVSPLPRSLLCIDGGVVFLDKRLDKSPLVWDDKRLFISGDQQAWIDERYSKMLGLEYVYRFVLNERAICKAGESRVYIMPMEDHPADDVVAGMRGTICDSMSL